MRGKAPVVNGLAMTAVYHVSPTTALAAKPLLSS
jgi:hypothetical protein